MRILWVAAVEREAASLRGVEGEVVVAGIGRTNAAAATTESILGRGPFDLVVSVGVAGALPRSGLELGDLVVAESCVYMEEGILEPGGFRTLAEMGLALGPFEGNRVPVCGSVASLAPADARRGAIATVATCSGSDAAAEEVVRRTGAIAEAMEGAAVVHAARRLGVAAGEIRAISNTTGDRARQRWDLERACASLRRLALDRES